jgi:hypothetical protein
VSLSVSLCLCLSLYISLCLSLSIYISPTLLNRSLHQQFIVTALLYSNEITIFLKVDGTDRGAIDFDELCTVDSSGQLETTIQLKTDFRELLTTETLEEILYDHPKLAELTIIFNVSCHPTQLPGLASCTKCPITRTHTHQTGHQSRPRTPSVQIHWCLTAWPHCRHTTPVQHGALLRLDMRCLVLPVGDL